MQSLRYDPQGEIRISSTQGPGIKPRNRVIKWPKNTGQRKVEGVVGNGRGPSPTLRRAIPVATTVGLETQGWNRVTDRKRSLLARDLSSLNTNPGQVVEYFKNEKVKARRASGYC